MIANTRTTDPSVEPVTATELDTHLRGDGELVAAESAFLDTLISSAREYVELETRLALITQTWTMYLDHFPGNRHGEPWWDGVREGAISQLTHHAKELTLPISPLISVDSLKTFDGENTATTFADSNYFLDTTSKPGQLILNNGTVWPVFTRDRRGIEIVYQVGFGAAPNDVPRALRQAVLQLAAHWYENREYVKTQSDQNQAPTPMHVQRILNLHKVRTL